MPKEVATKQAPVINPHMTEYLRDGAGPRNLAKANAAIMNTIHTKNVNDMWLYIYVMKIALLFAGNIWIRIYIMMRISFITHMCKIKCCFNNASNYFLSKLSSFSTFSRQENYTSRMQGYSPPGTDFV